MSNNILAYGSVSVINVDDGNGIVSSITEYWISDNGVIEPNEILADDYSINDLTDEEGNQLLGFTWYDYVPDVEKGMFLWSKTTFTYDNGDTSVAYNVTRWGQDGSNGKDGLDGKDGVDGKDGNGIEQVIVSYAISPDGNTTPIDGLIDDRQNDLYDNGDQLYAFLWSDEIPPNIPYGWYLWTRTRIIFTDGSQTDTYSISRISSDGEDGLSGKDAPKIVAIIPEYLVSNSNSADTQFNNDDWSETRPQLESGQFLWTRYRTEFDDESIIYSSAICDTTLSGIISIVDNNNQAIIDKVWETEISTAINDYDNSTTSLIRDRVTANETDISGIKSNITDLQTDVTNKADGSSVTALTDRVSSVEQDITGYKQTVSATYATKSSIPEFIVGTQTNATNAWAGISTTISSLLDGQQITYWLPYDSNSEEATLTLMLANNQNTTPIPIYYNGTTRLTNQYNAGTAIRLIYRQDVSLNGQVIDSGWWCDANYDSGNTYDRVKYNGAIKAAENIQSNTLCVSNGNGYIPLGANVYFDINYPILYFPDYDLDQNAISTDGYLVYPADITNTQNITLTSGKAVYLKGTLSGLTFTPVSSSPITQMIPTTQDGYHYLLLGMSFGTSTDTTTYYLQADHPIYIYRNGQGFVKIETAALTVAEQTAEGFSWVVSSGTSSSDFQITDRVATLVSNYINLNGLVTFNGLSGAVQNRINTLESDVDAVNSQYNDTWELALLVNSNLQNYKDENSVIIGTQNASSAIFTGVAKFEELSDGQQITYWLPYDYSETNAYSYAPTGGTTASGAALKLTLSNESETDTIPCFFSGLTRLTNQYPQGNIIRFVYRENVTLDNQTIAKGWWADANYDSGNTFDRIRYQQDITANQNITYNNIIVGYNGGYHNLNTGTVFDLTYPILWCGNTLVANSHGSNNFLCIPFVSTNTQNSTWEIGKPVFIQGTINGTLFTPVNTTPLTQIVPTSNNGYQYILLGNAYATNSIYLTYDHSIYQYHDGGFKTTSQIATETAVIAVAAETKANSATNWIESYGSNISEILATWTADATLSTTEIDGGFIKTHTITSQHLATNAIVSNNFVAAQSADSPYSAAGTFLDLANGNIYTQNFGIDNVSGTAYLNGEIIADSGSIGADSTNYWEIGTKTDYNGDDSAALIGHGTSYIQSGWWQVSNNRINTCKYDQSNKIEYLNDGNNYYDYGMQVPSFTSDINGADAWLYVRKSASNTIPTIANDWNYIFKIDKDGYIYENGIKLSDKYASIDSVDSSFLPIVGGTVTGDVTINGTLTATASSAASLSHTLNINGITWNGSANQVIGTMLVPYGGTGHSSWTANRLVYTESTNKLSELDGGTSGYILQSNGTSNAPSWVNPNTLVPVSANQVENDLIIKFNNGTTEGSNLFTFNGSVAKTINITKTSIGLGNVDNTADANKNVAHAVSATNADTATVATSASKITTPINFTIGNTTKSVDMSSTISYSKADIANEATSSVNGWMSAADKAKLDSISVDDIGTVSASSILGSGGINVSNNNGVATVSHSNSAITAGTISGTATSTLINGGSFEIPSITYDNYGHITGTSTSTITLPTISFADTYDCRLMTNTLLKAGTNGIYGNNIILENAQGNYESLVLSYSNGTTKSKNTSGFRLGKIYWYKSITTVNQNSNTASNTIYESISNVDFRYATNCGTSLVANQAVYLVGTINNGLFYLDNTWWTQTLPTTTDNKIYIYIGEAVSTTNITFSANHPIYEYKDGRLRQYGSVSKTEIESALGYEIDSTYLKLIGGTLTGNLAITSNTASASKTTGSLTVSGGVGVSGDVYANSYSVNEHVNIVWNNASSSLDFVFA